MNPMIILIAIFCSLLIGFFGRHKRLGFWGFFFASMLLTPVFGLLLLVIAAPAKQPAQDTAATMERGSTCPGTGGQPTPRA